MALIRPGVLQAGSGFYDGMVSFSVFSESEEEASFPGAMGCRVALNTNVSSLLLCVTESLAGCRSARNRCLGRCLSPRPGGGGPRQRGPLTASRGPSHVIRPPTVRSSVEMRPVTKGARVRGCEGSSLRGTPQAGRTYLAMLSSRTLRGDAWNQGDLTSQRWRGIPSSPAPSIQIQGMGHALPCLD